MDAKESSGATSPEFRAFRNRYLVVYCVVMLADWLQGTNMYTLYMSYGVSVSSLFLTGFLCSAVFGTSVGLYVDTMGRRTACIVYCVLEIIINVLEHVNNMPLLLFGRFLGVMAILAGVLAQFAADARGEIGPFQLAIALTVLANILVCFWEENYGETDA